MIAKIEINFPVPVKMPKGWEQKLDSLVREVCEKYEQDHPGRVMWPFGHGYKMTYIPMTRAEELRRGVEWDESVYEITVSERAGQHDKNECKPGSLL